MSTVSSSNCTIPEKLVQEFENRLAERAKRNERLAPYLAYQIGGPAELLLFPKDEAELCWISEVAANNGIPVTIVGTGTNLLVADEGIQGITISLLKAFRHIVIQSQDEVSAVVECGAGVSKPDFLEWSILNKLGGLEFSSGVPGTIGGGIFMNAGTKYGSYGDILKKLRLFDFDQGPRDVEGSRDLFGYRHQKIVTPKTLVVSATFVLPWRDPIKVRQEVDRIIQERAEKQPLDFPSCGSTFKNPEGYSAGRLIEKSGLKGTRIGGAEISTKHANFILNKKDATAHDILSLIHLVQKTVEQQFGVKLEKEVIVLGGEHTTGEVPNYGRVQQAGTRP